MTIHNLKKIFFISIFLSTSLFSFTYFDDGVNYYKSRNYEKAFEIFFKLSEDGINAKDLDFYLGLSAFRLKKFNEALFSFDRILMETDERDSDNINRVKLELARTHLALGEKESAKKLFKEVLDSNPPKVVANNILRILESMKKKKPEPKEFNFFVNIDFGYEENMNSQPSNEVMESYINNPAVVSEDAIASSYIQEMANIGYSHNFEDTNFWISSNLFAFNQNYIGNSDYDISYFSFGLNPMYQTETYKVEIPVKTEYVLYGGKELLTANSVGLKGSKFIENRFIKAILFDAFTNYKIKRYATENQEQDSGTFLYGLALTTKYKQHRFNIKYTTEYETAENNISTKNSNRTDKIINSISVKYDRADIFNIFNLTLAYSFRNIVYDTYEALEQVNPNINDGCRKDRYQSFKIGFSREIIKNLNGDIGFKYIINRSNHIPAEYKNSITNFGVSYIF